jgi:hypothetical protein
MKQIVTQNGVRFAVDEKADCGECYKKAECPVSRGACSPNQCICKSIQLLVLDIKTCPIAIGFCKKYMIVGTCDDCKKQDQVLSRYGSETGPLVCGSCYFDRLY